MYLELLYQVGFNCGTCFNIQYKRRSHIENLYPAKISVFPSAELSTSVKSTLLFFHLRSKFINGSLPKYTQKWIENGSLDPKESKGMSKKFILKYALSKVI